MPNVEAAYLEARTAAIEMIAEMMRERIDPLRFQFEIFDVDDRFLIELPFAEVVRSRPRAIRPPSADSILACIHRGRTLKADLRSELERARSLLASSRAILARSRAR